MPLIDDPAFIAMVDIRVVFLVLFTGAYVWFNLLFLRGARLLPPPQRLHLVSGLLPRFLVATWAFFVVMSIGGIGSMIMSVPLSLASILQSKEGLVIILEMVVTLLILASNALIQFLFLPRTRVEISATENADRSLKWLAAKGSKTALDSLSRVSLLGFTNLVLGVVAIALGVLYSSLL